MEDEVILITDNVVDNVEKANGKEMTEKLEKVQEEEEGDSKDIQEVEIVQDTEEKKIDEGMEHAQEKGVS
jgi:hypothetical protein